MQQNWSQCLHFASAALVEKGLRPEAEALSLDHKEPLDQKKPFRFHQSVAVSTREASAPVPRPG